MPDDVLERKKRAFGRNFSSNLRLHVFSFSLRVWWLPHFFYSFYLLNLSFSFYRESNLFTFNYFMCSLMMILKLKFPLFEKTSSILLLLIFSVWFYFPPTANTSQEPTLRCWYDSACQQGWNEVSRSQLFVNERWIWTEIGKYLAWFFSVFWWILTEHFIRRVSVWRLTWRILYCEIYAQGWKSLKLPSFLSLWLSL